MMPEKVFDKLRNSILPQWKVCFFSALILGLMAHMYKITGWLPNWDSLVFRYDAQNMIGLGRWFLPVSCAISSFYDLPFLNGLIAILLHCVGAVYICRVMRVNKNVTAFVIGGIVATFPAFTSVLMYNYVSDGYSIAFLLSCIASHCLTSHKPRYVWASLCIALSAGIYQAYITVSVMLVIFHLADELVYREKSVLYIAKKGVKILLAGLAGMLLYIGVLYLLLFIQSQKLLDYQGMSTAMSASAIDLVASLYAVKETFLDYFFDFSNGISAFTLINCSIFAFTVCFYIVYAVKSKLYKSPLKLVAVLLLCAMLIMGGAVIAFINPDVDYHNLMLMGYCVFYMFFVILYERGEGIGIPHIRCWLVLILSTALIFNQIVIANVSYHKAQMAYEKSYGTLVRIADRIEQVDESQKCTDMLVVGALSGSEPYSSNLPPDITGVTDGYIIRFDDETVGQSVFCSALNDYCAKDYRFLSGSKKKKLMEKEEIKNMNSWPEKNCVAVIDGVLVVKLGEADR